MSTLIFKKLITYQYSLSEIVDYFRAYKRYYLHKYLPTLLPKHILSQIEYRLSHADKECISNGECLMCGCKTPYLFYTNRSCDKPCYPTIVSKKDWLYYEKFGMLIDRNGDKWHYTFKLPFKRADKKESKYFIIRILSFIYNFKRY